MYINLTDKLLRYQKVQEPKMYEK